MSAGTTVSQNCQLLLRVSLGTFSDYFYITFIYESEERFLVSGNLSGLKLKSFKQPVTVSVCS